MKTRLKLLGFVVIALVVGLSIVFMQQNEENGEIQPSESSIDSSVVWERIWNEDVVLALHQCGRNEIDCIRSVMEQHDATQGMLTFFEDTGWFAVDFQEYGAVDLLSLADPWRANSNSDYALVNGNPAFVVVEDELRTETISNEPSRNSRVIAEYMRLADIFPEYTLWGTDNTFLEKKDNTFVFLVDLKDERGCHACSSGYGAVVAFEFDAIGTYLGPRFIETRESAF